MPARHPRRVNRPRTSEPVAEQQAGSGVWVRLGWMVACPLIMLFAGFTIASSPKWTFGASDGAFFFGCVLAIAFRYRDIRGFEGQTANGQPATMADFRRYALGLSTIAVGCWVAAQSVRL